MKRQVDFWSSTECALFLHGLIGALAGLNWSGRARHKISESEYRGARGRLARLSLRWETYVRYPWRLRQELQKGPQPEVAVVCTNTFYAPRVAELATRSTPIVHWVFDLFPDVLILSGSLRAGSALTRLLDRLVRATFDQAAVNVFLGERLLAHAVARFGPIPRCMVIPIGCDARPFAGSPPKKRNDGEPVNMLYCGNLGRMHDIDTVADSIRLGLPEKLRFRFHGNGVGFRVIENIAQDIPNRVVIGGSLKDAEWIEAMIAADIALVTMKPGAEGVVMPSKTYSALAAGQAVLAVCPDNSDLAETIRAYECGWVVRPGDTERLSILLREIASQPDEVQRRRENAWKAGQQVFDQRILAEKWDDVLAEALKYKSSQARNRAEAPDLSEKALRPVGGERRVS